MTLRCLDKGKYARKLYLEIILVLLNTGSLKMAVKQENIPRGHLHEGCSLRGLDGWEWWQSTGWHWVTEKGYSLLKQQGDPGQFPLQKTKWGLWVSLCGPAASSNCTTEVNRKHHTWKVGLGLSFLTSPQAEQVSHR